MQPTRRSNESLPRDVVDAVRTGVRRTLEGSPMYEGLDAEQRRHIARGMVQVSLMATKMAHRDRTLTDQIRRRAPLAEGQSAGEQLGMQAVENAPDVLRRTRDAIAFPQFVQSMISGVFQAILQSSTQQVGSLSELLDHVSASSDDFEATISDEQVIGYALAKFSFLQSSEGGVALRENLDIEDYRDQLRVGLNASDEEVAGIDDGDFLSSLLPLVRRKMARDQQGVLASMVQMGLQRIVVDEGQLHASMDLRVDASSASQQETLDREDYRVNAGASASAGFGPWGASVSASTSIGRVQSDAQYTEEQIGVRAGLRSSVDLAFRTEQVPLDRLADANARVSINAASRVPVTVASEASGALPSRRELSAPSVGEVPDVPDAPTAPTPPDLVEAGREAARRGTGRSGDRGRGRDSGRSDRGRGRDRSGDRGRDRGRDAGRSDRGRGRGAESSRDRGRERGTDRSGDRGRERGTDRSGDRGRGRGAESSRDRGRERGTDRSGDRGRERGTDRSGDRGRERDTNRSGDRGRERDTNRSGDRDRRRDADRGRDRRS